MKTEEISLDLLARDKKQRSILDLKPEEITLMDGGEAVKITSLRLIKNEAENNHLITLIFDQLKPSLKKSAADVAAKVFKAVPQDKFSFAVLKVGPGRLGLLQPFTADRNALNKAVDEALEPDQSVSGKAFEKGAEDRLTEVVKSGADASGARVSGRDRMLARSLFDALQDSARTVQDQHAQAYLSELLALVGAQQKIAGRKALIYFTQGNYTDSTGKQMLRSIVGAANRADVSIYTIDLTAFLQGSEEKSLTPLSGMFALSELQTDYGEMAAPISAESSSERYMIVGGTTINYHDRSPSQELADGTCGIYIDGARNLQKPLQRLVQDMTTYYEASYLPAVSQYDGRFRSVAVKPLRKGIKIQSRAGYFAIPPDAASGVRPFELPLLKILSGTELPQDLAFRATILRLGNLPNRDGNTLAIEVPLSGVTMRQDTNTNLYSTELAMVAQVKDKSGTVLEKFSEEIPHRGPLEQIEKAKSQVVTVQRHFDVPAGDYVIEAAIQDQWSGKTGAQRIPFEVADDARGPSLSDMVLVRRIEPFHAETDPLEPLWHGDEKVSANLSEEVMREEKNASVFFVTHRDPQSSEPATLSLQMMKDEKPVAGMPAASQEVTGAQAVSHLASFPVGSLPNGAYEMKATLSQGGKTATTTTAFKLEGNQSSPEPKEAGNGDSLALSVGSGELPSIQFSTGSVQPPPPNQIKSILDDATERANRYGVSLPNFVCTQVTSRSVDPDGNGRWRHQDTITERLTYVDNVEKRTILALNGRATTTSRQKMMGTLSEGELGGALKMVFQPSSKTNFQWKESGMLGPGPVQVFNYQVSHDNSAFVLAKDVSGGEELVASFHGEIFIDNATHSVRRITMVADDLPETFFLQGTSVAVDYDYIGINGHDFLLPVGAQVGVSQRGRRAMLNEIEFRDYRRFGSKVKITDLPPKS